MYQSFGQLMQERSKKEAPRMAVAVAADWHTVEAALEAAMRKTAQPVFVGDATEITRIITGIGARPNHYHIVDAPDPAESCKAAVALVRAGEADFLMKGMVDSAVLLKAVLDKQGGLSTGSVMSHVAMLEIPSYHKLLTITDGGMLPYPNLAEKKAILQNAVTALQQMGYDCPKVGAVTCVEKVHPKMPETVDAHALKTQNQSGEISGCLVEGPISYDCAIDAEIARGKGFDSPVSGDVDILLVPNIHVGNILSKALICNAGATMTGFIVGATCPIVLSSRGATALEKYLSIAVCAAGLQEKKK